MAEVEEIDISTDFTELYEDIDRKINQDVEVEQEPEVQPLDFKQDFTELYDTIHEKINFSNLSEDEKNIKDDLYYAQFADEAFKNKKQRNNIDDYRYLQKASNNFVASYVNDNKKEIVIAYKGTDFKEIWEQLQDLNPLLTEKERLELHEKFKDRLYDPAEMKANPILQLLMDLQIFTGDFAFPTVGELGNFIGGMSGVEFSNQGNVINKLKKLYPDYNTIFTGFSLGGALSRRSHMSNKENSRAITFNGATGVSPMFDETMKCIGGDCKIKNYRIKNDLISKTGLTEGDIITLEPKKSVLDDNKGSYFPHHSIKHFIDRKKFKPTSGFEIGDNPLAQVFASGEVFRTFNNVFGLPNIIKSPQVIMGFLNSIVDFVNDKSFMPTARVGRERIRSRLGREIARFNRPPPLGRPISEMQNVRKMFYPDEL